MGKTFGSWLIILCLLFSSTLLHITPASAASQPADPSLQLGIDKFHSGDQQEALSLLRGFVIRNYDSPELPRAYLYLARIFQNSGSHQEALLYISRIPLAQKGPEALCIEGVSLVATGQFQAGLTTLLNTDPESLTPNDRSRRLAALAEANAGLGNYLEALTFIHRSAKPTDSKLLELAHGILKEHLSPTEIGEAAFMFRDTAIGQDAILQLALGADKRNDQNEAKRLAAAVIQNSTPFPYRNEAVALWEKLNGSPFLQRSIGVMLPLTGRYAPFGQLVRRGMELASDLHDQNKPPIHLEFRDSGATAEESSRIVTELSGEAGVMAIAGPLTGGAAAAAAAQAQRIGIPLLSLSPRDGLPETGSFIFRDSLTSRQQVEALVSHAMERLGITAFAILHPENKLGYEMTDLFIRAVQNRGGQVVATQMYAEKATDFRRQVRLLKEEDPASPDVDPKAEPDEVVEDDKAVQKVKLPFQALFIPDYADKISLIAPQLLFYGIEDVQLLGINGWNSRDLLRSTGRYLQGAIFVDGFFRASADPSIRQFVENYTAAYGEEPSILEAQGFDVANILFTLLDRPEIRTRDELQQALSQLIDFHGVSGNTSFGTTGDALKTLFLLQVDRGDIIQLN
ncbi:MAG: hypothetical protein A2X84_10465 [Desulfuromonadaceae bacterium GWC2_58_13]|nr:MAG: hypothetical protein A2X84_10465 [Desulfuromonadaceae bacterium GWC2_58_13]